MAEIESFRERIEAAKRKAEIEYDKKQQREFNEKLRALSDGDHVPLTEEEKDFIWSEMDCTFLGDTPDVDKMSKWGMARDAATELGKLHKTVVEVVSMEPREDRRHAMMAIKTMHFFACDKAETQLLKKIMYLCDTFLISAMGEYVQLNFSFNNVWTKKGEFDV